MREERKKKAKAKERTDGRTDRYIYIYLYTEREVCKAKATIDHEMKRKVFPVSQLVTWPYDEEQHVDGVEKQASKQTDRSRETKWSSPSTIELFTMQLDRASTICFKVCIH